MPSGRRATDVLWQYLCPIASASKERQKCLKCVIRCPNLQLRPIIQLQHFHKRPWIRPPSLLRSVNLQAQRCSHWKTDLVTVHVREQGRMRVLDITSAYQQLRSLALKGDYTHIRNCVTILVKERGQKPNLRLYEALLLANTDTEYGSAGQVARILSDIAAEGLTPDSATYHAALRVWECSRQGQSGFGLHHAGSCNTSRLSFEATHTRRTTSAMVSFDQGRLPRCDHRPSQRATSRACA